MAYYVKDFFLHRLRVLFTYVIFHRLGNKRLDLFDPGLLDRMGR